MDIGTITSPLAAIEIIPLDHHSDGNLLRDAAQAIRLADAIDRLPTGCEAAKVLQAGLNVLAARIRTTHPVTDDGRRMKSLLDLTAPDWQSDRIASRVYITALTMLRDMAHIGLMRFGA